MNPTSVITLEDITTIFYKMDDFYQIHHEFVTEMNKKVQNWSDDQEIADDVKKLVRILKKFQRPFVFIWMQNGILI